MREFAIGDIHGCARALETMLGLLDLQRTDTVVFLGDYIDRGPDSCRVLDMILELNRHCAVIPLTGNHEKMLLHLRTEPHGMLDWLRVGGIETLDSYVKHGFERRVSAIPERHWRFLDEQMLDYWESERHIFVHASLDPKLELHEQSDDLLFWERFSDPMAHHSGKRILCGHTSQKSGMPALFRGGICIDTWAHGGGWLTCYETGGNQFIQTNERGEQRNFDLLALMKA